MEVYVVGKKLGLIFGIIIVAIIIITAAYYLLYPKTNETDVEKLNRNISSEEKLIMDKNVFTKETLSQYDGKDGHKAYIDVNGIVYDVSDIKQWENGEHHGLKAGQDLTKEFLKSPHGHAVLQKLNIVGKYHNE